MATCGRSLSCSAVLRASLLRHMPMFCTMSRSHPHLASRLSHTTMKDLGGETGLIRRGEEREWMNKVCVRGRSGCRA